MTVRLLYLRASATECWTNDTSFSLAMLVRHDTITSCINMNSQLSRSLGQVKRGSPHDRRVADVCHKRALRKGRHSSSAVQNLN